MEGRDEMRICSDFTTNIISKLIKMLIRNKLGCDIEFKLNEVSAEIFNGATHVHLDVDAALEKDELIKILKNIGL